MTPLHEIGNAVRNVLLQVPLPIARSLFVGMNVLLFIWVLRLPNSQTTPDRETSRWSENLKIGASLALIAQILIYALI